MSRSLSRIRSLISDIEEIHRQGQQSRPVKLGSMPTSEPARQTMASVPLTPEQIVATQENAATVSLNDFSPGDSFADLAQVVHFDKTAAPGKIFMKLSGSIALSLQIDATSETVEVKQVGELLEIRFNDGKVFHLPLKAVA